MNTVYHPGFWQPIFRGHCYSGSAIALEWCEDAMRGTHKRDVLWRKVEERARKMIWC